MNAQRNREEAVNTQLAILISKLGVTADAETIHVHGKHRPDVIFEMRGLRIVIEGKFTDHPSAYDVVLEDARKRVSSGIAHIAAAAVYPLELRSAPTTKIIETLENAKLRYRIVSESHESEEWFEGTPASLMDALRRVQEALSQDDIVEQVAKSLSAQLETVARLWNGQPGACDRLSRILGIIPPEGEEPANTIDRRDTAAKVSALVLANAFIFQEQLSITDTRVETLRKIEKNTDVVDATSKHWHWIWENINYVPIFQLGERLLDELPSSPNSTLAVKALLGEAQAICRQQAALRHDLMGRIYHWLLHDAKFLGTYYTSVSAATLLLKLVFALDWKNDFASPRELADFKVADLACGTGTLLMAAAQALTDRHIRDRAEQDLSLSDKDVSILHQTLMQNVMHGYDVLPTAVHLTASTLALLAPDVAFRNMNLFVMPMGLDHGRPRLGSLDFLEGQEIRTQFALDDTQLDVVRTGASKSTYTNAKVPKLDLCVLNPPFTSSRYGNRLFGSLPQERSALQKALSKQAKMFSVSGTAGLGALFVPLANLHTKRGGRIAFVLPVALATGEAWRAIRRLIATEFHLEVVITSHDNERPNFSENTHLSEILFIARRLQVKEKPGTTIYVNLWHNPRTIHEALDCASRIACEIANVGQRVGETRIVRTGTRVIGEMASLPAPEGGDNWTGAIFAQRHLMQAYWQLNNNHEIRVPGSSTGKKVKLCRLDELGELGYDVRDIFDAFEVDDSASTWSPYTAFWNHDATKVQTIAQEPNATLIARTKALPKRKLKDANAVWSKAGKTLLVSRLWTNTHRTIATGFDKEVLGNTWWAFNDAKLSANQRKALLLWFNSTFGVLSYYGRRAITRGSWMQMKKPAWASMQVLNVKDLSKEILTELGEAYDVLAKKQLLAIAELDVDPVRHEIDDAFRKTLDLPDISSIRELLVREPGLSGEEIGNPTKK
ncbi:SAM-dependent methyltransferase [bacterium]|nr:SAM-dependent methyltransferase [bacterium]